MNDVRRTCGAALGVLVLTLAGCAEDRPRIITLVEVPAFPSLALVPYVDPGFPAAPAGATVYGRISRSVFQGSQRYVLHENGRFGLQYFTPQSGFFEYPGSYSSAGSIVTFSFDLTRDWTATASVDGDFLNVTYNDNMVRADFENAVFVRTSGSGS